MNSELEIDFNEKYGRIFKGYLAVGFTFSLRIIDRIAIIPVLIYLWSAHTVSNWLIVFAFFAHVTLILSGIPTQAVNYMNDKVIRKDWRAVQELYSNAFFLLIIVSGLLIFFFFSTQNLINWNKLIGLDAISLSETKWLNLIFILFYSFTAILSLPSQAYRAYGLFSRGQMIGNIRMIILFLLIAVAVFSGYGPITVAILYLITLLIDISCLSWDLPRRCPELKFKMEFININAIKVIGRDGLIFTVLMLGETLSLQTNLMITSHILGASSMLGFILMRALINLLSTISYEFGRVLWPEITLLRINRDIKEFKNINIMLIKITTSAGIILAAFLFFSGTDLISCWSGVDNVLSPNVAMILSISLISKALYGGSSIFCIALNRLRFLASAQLIGGIVVTIFTILLTPGYGLLGSALAFVVSDIFFFTMPSLVCSAKIAGLSLRTVAKKVLFPEFLAFLLLLILSWFANMPSLTERWSRFAVAAILYFPLATFVLYWILLNKTERLEVKKIIKVFQANIRRG